jgi:hypothetical protein
MELNRDVSQKKRGRPASGSALSPAERQAAYRARKAAAGKGEMPSMFVAADVMDALKAYVDRQNADRAADPLTLGDAVEKILRDRLLRKR